jgi:hypothetical protein
MFKSDELLRTASEVFPFRPSGSSMRPEAPAAPSNNPMRILLQNKTTLHYVESADGWTAYVDNARVFSTGLEALTFCLNHQMANMQILGEFTDTRMNFTMPVTDIRGA